MKIGQEMAEKGLLDKTGILDQCALGQRNSHVCHFIYDTLHNKINIDLGTNALSSIKP